MSQEELLNRIARLESLISASFSIPTTIKLPRTIKYEYTREQRCTIPEDEIRDTFKNNRYVFITMTFDPKIIHQCDEKTQFIKLMHALYALREKDTIQTLSCFEKHQSGILHAHIMTTHDIYEIEKPLRQSLLHISKSKKLQPAIKYEIVKDTYMDKCQTFNYLLADKEDHPLYKYFVFWK